MIGICLYVRLEIEAQEQALEQLEKSAQEATRKAHDAEQKAKSALDALKVCLSDKLDLPSLAHHKRLFHSDHGNLLHTGARGSVLQQALSVPPVVTLLFPSTEDSLNRGFGDVVVPKADSSLVVQEKDQMLKYVEEEVDRVKGLFEQKEARLTSERDSAKQAAQQLAREQGALTQKLHHLQQELQQLPGALEVTLLCVCVWVCVCVCVSVLVCVCVCANVCCWLTAEPVKAMILSIHSTTGTLLLHTMPARHRVRVYAWRHASAGNGPAGTDENSATWRLMAS